MNKEEILAKILSDGAADANRWIEAARLASLLAEQDKRIEELEAFKHTHVYDSVTTTTSTHPQEENWENQEWRGLRTRIEPKFITQQEEKQGWEETVREKFNIIGFSGERGQDFIDEVVAIVRQVEQEAYERGQKEILPRTKFLQEQVCAAAIAQAKKERDEEIKKAVSKSKLSGLNKAIVYTILSNPIS